MTTIKRTYDGVVLFSHDSTSVAETLKAAVAQGADLRCANLQRADLRSADLQGADLRSANLRSADLQGAYLQGAYLQGAYLQGADLQGADLQGADLQGADLRNADLRSANLQGADLRSANLRNANLRSANLRSANLRSAYLQGAEGLAQQTVAGEGVLTGYKKLSGEGVIAVLTIPAHAQRVNAYGSRKCRAECAVVVSGAGYSDHDRAFKYTPGICVYPDKFDPDPRVECSNGIHFFITREEAEEY